MSEYQYYEFQAVDRRLSAEELADVGSLSSRVQLTPTRAIFTYNYGDFRGDPLDVLERHFDALMHLTNWGSRQLAFRFPRASIEGGALAAYVMNSEEIELRTTPQHVVLNIGFFEGESEGWLEQEETLDPLLPLRDAVLRGDLRVLCLAWLRSAQDYDEADAVEPPVPAGLGELSPALLALADFLSLDPDIIAAAAEASPALVADAEPLEQWVALLSPEERDAFVVRVARGEPLVQVELLRRLRALGRQTPPPAPDEPRRSWAELKDAATPQRSRRLAAEREAAERTRLAALEALAGREEQAWAEVEKLLAKRSGGSYDQAVALLAELRDLARHRSEGETFARRLAESVAPVASSTALQRRLREHGLVA